MSREKLKWCVYNIDGLCKVMVSIQGWKQSWIIDIYIDYLNN